MLLLAGHARTHAGKGGGRRCCLLLHAGTNGQLLLSTTPPLHWRTRGSLLLAKECLQHLGNLYMASYWLLLL